MTSDDQVIPLPSSPFRVEFEVNARCNLACRYCYALPFSGPDPELGRLVDLFQRTREEVNPFEVVLLGGEPFLRTDILDLLESGREIFGAIGVSTNGTLLPSLSDTDLDRLRVISGRGNVQVSLDSVEKHENDYTRGLTEQSIRGLDALEENEIKFAIGIVLTRANSPGVERTLRHVLTHYQNLTRLNIMNLMPSQALSQQYFDLACEPEVRSRTWEITERIKEELGRPDVDVISDMDSGSKPLLATSGIHSCLAGLLRVTVMPNGDVTPCSLIRTVAVGNVYREGWGAICARSLQRFMNFEHTTQGGAQCAVFNLVSTATSTARQ